MKTKHFDVGHTPWFILLTYFRFRYFNYYFGYSLKFDFHNQLEYVSKFNFNNVVVYILKFDLMTAFI